MKKNQLEKQPVLAESFHASRELPHIIQFQGKAVACAIFSKDKKLLGS